MKKARKTAKTKAKPRKAKAKAKPVKGENIYSLLLKAIDALSHKLDQANIACYAFIEEMKELNKGVATRQTQSAGAPTPAFVAAAPDQPADRPPFMGVKRNPAR